MNKDDRQMFGELQSHYRADSDSRGEVHVDCPNCGKETKRGQTHFSFSVRGAKCMVCGFHAGLATFYHQILGEGQRPTIRPIMPLPAPKPPKKQEPLGMDLDQYFTTYRTRPDLLDLWQKYKPITSEQLDNYKLGYGVLPRNACHHPRLTIPIFSRDGSIIHIRGRNAGCPCETKWAVSGGWTMGQLEPFNWQTTHAPIMLILENPIDAMMVTGNQRTISRLLVSQLSDAGSKVALDYIQRGKLLITAIATLSTSYWRDSWAEYLREAAQVFVMYDNDLPGNGGAWNRHKFIRLWQDGNEEKAIPPAKGVELANRLIKQGIPATLFDWKDKPRKYDLGDYLKENA